MKTPRTLLVALTVFGLNPSFLSAAEISACVELIAPVTLVADFNADGRVNGRDIKLLSRYVRNNRKAERQNRRAERQNRRFSSHRSRHNRTYETFYSPLFDRNADGEVNYIDLFKATRDMGKRSTPEDQELATISNEIIDGTYTCFNVSDTDGTDGTDGTHGTDGTDGTDGTGGTSTVNSDGGIDLYEEPGLD